VERKVDDENNLIEERQVGIDDVGLKREATSAAGEIIDKNKSI
jgi:hypothetical protein